jgi:acyl-CoA synthetase (AMP-forming)/AMP-acid ligase II
MIQSFVPSTLVELLRHRAVYQPDKIAYTFLEDGETEENYLTYTNLDREARAIGARLQSLGMGGERTLLLYSPGLKFIAAFFGCLYAGVIAIPVYPLQSARLDRALPRFRAVANDARAVAVLTSSTLLSIAEHVSSQAPDMRRLRWLATDTIDSNLAKEWQQPALSSTSLAFLQYTSGSTAAPKGVMLTHGNVLHNCSLIEYSFEHTVESQGVIWLPPYHDMGLIGGVMTPLYGGFPVTLMSPMSFIQTPRRWLQAISRFRATHSGGPTFAYDLCIRKITPDQRATLDLSSWEVAFTGAEPVRHEVLERFAATFAPCGFRLEAFYPCYGLAEATLIVSGGLKAAPPVVLTVQSADLEPNMVVTASKEDGGAQKLVGCGTTRPDQKIVIADPETLTSCLPWQVGEIWVSGPSVTQGYWNRSEETERTYRAYLSDTKEGPFLRTGDLGFLMNGELFVTGRINDLIIIDGRNYYPQDIELRAEQSHPSIRPGCCAAFSVDIENEERLVVVAEVERRLELKREAVAAVVAAIRRAVAEFHEVRVYTVVLLKPGSIPKTPSGKIQRHACRASFLTGSLNVIDGG